MSKILFVAKNLPNKIKSAGDIRALNMLRILKKNYDNIHVVAQSADYGDGDVKGAGCNAYIAGEDKIKQIINDQKLEIIILSHWTISERYLQQIRKISNAKIFVDTIDVAFLREQREHDYFGEDICPQVHIDNAKSRELRTYNQADGLIVTAEQDKEVLQKEGFSNIIMLPCLFTINKNIPAVSNNNCYLISNWAHLPNHESAVYLCRNIVPYVDIKLHIVGKHPPARIMNFASEKIIIHGAEYRLNVFLQNMSICLAPIFFGAGMNGKIGEALAFGIPVITTTYGAVPYKLKNNESAMIVNNDNDFINAVNEILQNEQLRSNLVNNGKALVEKFTIDKWQQSFLESIQ